MDNMGKIIFVYNADAGLFSTVSDFAHKIISPETYACNLCKLTYGNLSMKNEWKEFLGSLENEKIFLHRDEFKKQFPQLEETAFPCVFISREGQAQLLLSAEEINGASDIGGFLAIDKINPEELMGREIILGEHCLSCTAGSGSSCQGALASEEVLTQTDRPF